MRPFFSAAGAISIMAPFIASGAQAGAGGTAGAGGNSALVGMGDPLACDLDGYAPDGGPAATMEQNTLLVTWAGAAGADLRLRLGLEDAAPIVRDLAIRPQGSAWGTLGRNLVPDFHVTSGCAGSPTSN